MNSKDKHPFQIIEDPDRLPQLSPQELNREIARLEAEERKKPPRRICKPWTEEEIECLKKHHGTVSTAKLAKILGRSIRSVQGEIERLDLKKDGVHINDVFYHSWTEAEYKKLIAMYGKFPIIEIARQLNRSYHRVAHKITELGLTHR